MVSTQSLKISKLTRPLPGTTNAVQRCSRQFIRTLPLHDPTPYCQNPVPSSQQTSSQISLTEVHVYSTERSPTRLKDACLVQGQRPTSSCIPGSFTGGVHSGGPHPVGRRTVGASCIHPRPTETHTLLISLLLYLFRRHFKEISNLKNVQAGSGTPQFADS